MIVESSFRGWGDARIALSERGDFYTDYRRELGEKNFLILPGVEATAVLFDDEGNTVRLHHMNGILGREHAKRCIGKYLFTYGKSRA